MPLQRSVERPIFWIVAGPNGSGKSTFARTTFEAFGRSVWIINPDVLAAHIREIETLSLPEANAVALDRIMDWLRSSVRAYQTVGVETVLSTDKYRELLLDAKRRGFQIRLTYVILDSPDRNVERIRIRVQAGGHAVPDDKVRERYERSLAQLPWFLSQADSAVIFDNSGAPRQIAQKEDGVITVDENALPTIIKAAEQAATIE